MKILAITHKGLEDIAQREVLSIINKPAKNVGAGIVFEANEQEVVEFIYMTRICTSVVQLLSDFDFTDLDSIAKQVSAVVEYPTFGVKTVRIGEHGFNSPDVSDTISMKIKGTSKFVYRNPDITYFALVVDNHIWFGIDLCGEDLGRRDYRIFLNAESVKGSLASGLLEVAGYAGGQFLDPFCRDGIIAIEATNIDNNRSPHFYHKDKFFFNKMKDFSFAMELMLKIDGKQKIKTGNIFSTDVSFPHIQSGRKNAKLAGVLDSITLTKVDYDWIDIKFENESFMCIATHSPELGRTLAEPKLAKIYDTFFLRSSDVLHKKGVIAVLTGRTFEIVKASAEKHKFKLKSEREVYSGDVKYKMMVFSK